MYLHLSSSVIQAGSRLGNGDVRHRALAMLRAGNSNITVDLACVRKIDAAGIGELVRIYNITQAYGAKLRIVKVTQWVRRVLRLVGLFDLLRGRLLVTQRRDWIHAQRATDGGQGGEGRDGRE